MEEYDFRLGAMDIGYWFRQHETCPNCGVNFKAMHPLMNLYPHWTGACNRPEPTPENQFTMTWKQKIMRLINWARG